MPNGDAKVGPALRLQTNNHHHPPPFQPKDLQICNSGLWFTEEAALRKAKGVALPRALEVQTAMYLANRMSRWMQSPEALGCNSIYSISPLQFGLAWKLPLLFSFLFLPLEMTTLMLCLPLCFIVWGLQNNLPNSNLTSYLEALLNPI